MGSIRTYKRKLILTATQEKTLNSWIGACRVVYNLGLQVRIEAWQKSKKSVSKFDLIKQLTSLRNGFKWIEDVPANSLTNAIYRLDHSYNRFFNNGSGFPKFATKRKFKSISFRQYMSANGNKLRIPKIGYVKMFKDAPVLGDIKTVTVKKELSGYFAYIVCDNTLIKATCTKSIGIDMGITQFAADSNGGFIANPKHYIRYENRLRVENRSLARKVRYSKSWRKQVYRLSILHQKISNVRLDFLHKQSSMIAKSNGVVYLEDLKINNMVKNHSLSKHILDAGWGIFKIQLSYKTKLQLVNPKYTSQMCFACGCINKDNRPNQQLFKCVSCGYTDNADTNAAKNIKHKGIMLDRKREGLPCA